MKPKKGVVPPHLKKYLFKKKGKGMSKKRKSSSKALTVYRSAKPIVITKTRHIKVPVRVKAKHGGGRSLMRRELGSGEMIPGPYRMRSAAIAGALGYSETPGNLTFVAELLAKIPEVGKLPKEAIAGIILNYFSDRGDWFDAGAQAFLDIGAYKLGKAEFKMSGDDGDD